MNDPFSHILSPIDESAPSRASEDVAIELAMIAGRRLTFCHVSDGRDAVAEDILRAAVARAEKAGVHAQARVSHGESVTAITALAQDLLATCVVMGTRSPSGLDRLLVGSTTEGVLRASDIPVLTVNPQTRIDPQATHPFTKGLVAIDGSEPSQAAVATALDLAETNRVALHFLHVLDTTELLERAGTYGYDPTSFVEEMRAAAQPDLEDAVAMARARGIAAEGSTIQGDPVQVLLAELSMADIGIVGSHGRRGLRRFLLGSVAEELVRHAPVPMLVVRHAGAVKVTQSAFAYAANPAPMSSSLRTTSAL